MPPKGWVKPKPDAEGVAIVDAEGNPVASQSKKAAASKPATKAKPLTRDALKGLIETANWGFILSGKPYLALDPAEISQLAEVWYDVVALYPKFGNMIANGGKMTAWGYALLTTYMIVDKRMKYAAATPAHQTGGTYPNPGDDGQRENHVSPPAPEYQTVPDSFGFQT
jgi:hypothetical protein